eukprot:6182374-Pleurochrysis_carterae.AAC.2
MTARGGPRLRRRLAAPPAHVCAGPSGGPDVGTAAALWRPPCAQAPTTPRPRAAGSSAALWQHPPTQLTLIAGPGAEDSERHDGAPAAWRALIVFSGDGLAPSILEAELRERDADVDVVDIAVGGRDHDLARPEVAGWVLSWVRAGRYHAVFAATLCESFSVAHVPQLRTRLSPERVTPVPKRWARYLAKHNALARFTASLVQAADEARAVWAIENPADCCGDPDGVAWWPPPYTGVEGGAPARPGGVRDLHPECSGRGGSQVHHHCHVAQGPATRGLASGGTLSACTARRVMAR